MKTLQTVTAVIEAGAGLALLGLPSTTASFLLGTPLDSPVAVSLARIGGAAILALAIICWLARNNGDSLTSRGLVARPEQRISNIYKMYRISRDHGFVSSASVHTRAHDCKSVVESGPERQREIKRIFVDGY